MYRDEAIELMCNTVNEMNRSMAAQAGLPSEQIEDFITQGQRQLKHVNGLLYDTLKENGVIA